MHLDPARLRFLLAVARNGGILSAADELNVTPSAVSQQLTRLERETGYALVTRGSKGSTLTPEGHALAEAAQDIENTLDSVRSRLEHGEAELKGPVRLGGFQSVLASIIAPALPHWHHTHPDARFRITEAYPETLTRLLKSGDLDAALFELDYTNPDTTALPAGMIETPLLDDPWKAVVPAGTLVSDITDLSRLELPWLGEQTTTASTYARARLHGITGADDSTVHLYGSVQTALALVAANEGMALIPELALRGYPREGIEVLDISGLGTRRIVLRSRPRSARARTLVSQISSLVLQAMSDHAH